MYSNLIPYLYTMTQEKQNFIENFVMYYTDYEVFYNVIDELKYGKYFYNKTIGELRNQKTDENFYKVCKEIYEMMKKSLAEQN